jgi:HD superfamily phosphohydrolase YqeK
MSFPSWAQAAPKRREHVQRVAGLVAQWADAMGTPAAERARWLRAVWLHDALRDAPAEDKLAHGPMAAERAAQEGEQDQGVLDAVRYHTVGYVGWDDAGKMLYLADYLDPGRTFEAADRTALAARVPSERDAVLREVVRRRIEWTVRSGWRLRPETIELWNSLASS